MAEKKAAYTKSFSRKDPGCIVILIDQSGSMDDPMDKTTSKKSVCATAVNRTLRELALMCQSGEDIVDRCLVGVIGYGDKVESAFRGKLAGKNLIRISEVAHSPVRIEEAPSRESRGAKTPWPVWIEGVADGDTPMGDAFDKARAILEPWVAQHQESFPPLVINVTDGEPQDQRAAEVAAAKLTALSTNHGNALLLNVHISADSSKPIIFPVSESALPNEFARFLFRISSALPTPLRASAELARLRAESGSRGFMFNADTDNLVKLLTIGTVAGMPTPAASGAGRGR